jgi:RNA polymerase sigma-70 factor (ECF subfamily)
VTHPARETALRGPVERSGAVADPAAAREVLADHLTGPLATPETADDVAPLDLPAPPVGLPLSDSPARPQPTADPTTSAAPQIEHDDPRPVPARLDAGFLDGAGLPDDYLVQQAARGSVEAFGLLVERHRDRAYRLAYRLVGDRALAEDVAQEALVSAWRGLPDFAGRSAFSTWLHRIVTNQALTLLSRPRRTVPLTGEEPVPVSEQPDRVVERRARTAALRAAVLALPFDQRAPLVLHQFEGLSYAEVADVLELTEPTVRGRLHRARRALVTAMADWR